MNIFEFDLLVTPIIAIFGLIFGSFATALIYRIPCNKQFITGRSKCPSCHHVLGILDLFPIISWLLLRGKCRYCHIKFGNSYPSVEIALSIMFVLTYLQLGISTQSIIIALVATTIIILIAIDFEHYIIPDGINLTLLVLGICYRLTLTQHWLYFILAPITGFAIGMSLRLLMQWWKKREGLGMGDVKFFTAAGLLIEPQMIASFFFLSGIIGLLTALLWKLKKRGERFPFGPALAIALLITLIYPEFHIWWQAHTQQVAAMVLDSAYLRLTHWTDLVYI